MLKVPEGLGKLGSVPFLNGRPLIYGLQESGVELVLAPPAQLAVMLEEGEISAGLIPVFHHIEHRRRPMVSGIGVGSRGPVRSLMMYLKVPPKEVKRLAVDEGSLTTLALARIILSHRYRSKPVVVRVPPVLDVMLEQADAAVLIGDLALTTPAPEGVKLMDLGEEWYAMTGLPMVYAAWIARDAATRAILTPLLRAAKREGTTHMEEIAQDGAQRLGLPMESCLSYLKHNIRYHVGEDEQRGLEEFTRICYQMGIR